MTKVRVAVLACLLSVPYLAILGRLYSLQVVPESRERHSRLALHPRSVLLPPVRGRILARDGTVMAGDRLVYHLEFRYQDRYLEKGESLNSRRIPVSILVRELSRHGPFPDPETVEQRLVDLATAVVDIPREARKPVGYGAPAADQDSEMVLLVDRVPSKAGEALLSRLAPYKDLFKVQTTSQAGIISRIWQSLPGVSSGEYRVYAHPRRAVAMEIALYRLALALSDGEPAGAIFDQLAANVEEALQTIESRVSGQMASPQYRHLRPDDPRSDPEAWRKFERERNAARRAHYRECWPLWKDIPESVATRIEYHPELYPGIRVKGERRREYPLGEAFGTLTGYVTRLYAPRPRGLLGFLGAVVTGAWEAPRVQTFVGEDVAAADFTGIREGKLESGDFLGRSGLEKYYDETLRGLYGRRTLMRDKILGPRILLDEVPPVHGRDIRTSIDPELQVLLYEALAQRIRPYRRHSASGVLGYAASGPPAPRDAGVAGSAVVLDVETGEVIASVGYPGIDVRRRLEEPGYTEKLETSLEVRDFLYDRPTMIPLYPGSVFKIFLAVAAMESATPWQGEYTDARRYACESPFPLFPEAGLDCADSYHPTAASAVNLAEALGFSCNTYFYYLGVKHLGPERIWEYARRFGFGRAPGIDLPLPAFAGGTLDPPSEVPAGSSVCRYSIGQVHVMATPLQVACAVAAVARGGRGLVPPRLALAADGARPQQAESLDLQNPRTLEVVHRGLWNAGHVPGGTVEKPELELWKFNAAYKTGTAQRDLPRHWKWWAPRRGDPKDPTVHNGWLVGFAPFDRPKIAFAVVIECTDLHGSEASGPVVRTLLEYFEKKHPGEYVLQDGGTGGMPGSSSLLGRGEDG